MVEEKLSPVRRLIIGVVALSMAGAGFAAGRVVFRPVQVVSQPVDFNHVKHVEEAGLECWMCHEHYETSEHSGLPELETCLGCHAIPWMRLVSGTTMRSLTSAKS